MYLKTCPKNNNIDYPLHFSVKHAVLSKQEFAFDRRTSK